MSTDVKKPATFDVNLPLVGRIKIPLPTETKVSKGCTPPAPKPPKDTFTKPTLTKSQKRLEAKLVEALGEGLAPLAKLTALLANTPLFKKHQKSINKLIANPSKKLELAVYVSNLTEFAVHRARLEGAAAKYLSETEDAKKTLDAVIEKFTKSADAAERKFGEKLKAANALLWKVKQGGGMPRPLGAKDPKKGVNVFDLHVQTVAEKEIAKVLDDKRFKDSWEATYSKTDEYKATQYEKQRVEDVTKAREVVKGLASTDANVRAKAREGLRELVTRIRVGVIHDKAVLKEILKADPDRVKAEDPVVAGEMGDLDTPMVSVSTIDDDAGAGDVAVQQGEVNASTKATNTRMKAGQALQDRVDALVRKLAKADPQAAWVQKLAARMEGYARARLVEPLKKSADEMRKYNRWDAQLVGDLIARIHTAKEPQDAIKLYREAQFWAQTGLLLANIRELGEGSDAADKQIEQDGTMTYWGSRIASLGFYRPERSSNSGWTKKSLEQAEGALLTARHMYQRGLVKKDPKRFMVLMRRAQIHLKGAFKQSEIAQKLTTSWQASFMRNMTGLLIVAAAAAASALTGGLAGALAPELLGAGWGALAINSMAFTAASATGNHYLMGQKATLGSFAEDFAWNTIMFGAFAKLGKYLKGRAGIAEAKVIESASFKDAWARTLKRYGMDEGLAWSRGNALTVFGRVLKKEGSVLAKEAAAFQVFEAGKLSFRHVTGVTAHPVQNYIDELRQLFTPQALLHGMGMLAAIKGVGYGSGRVTKGILSTKPFVKVQVKRINAALVETQRLLVENHKAKIKGEALLSDAAEAALWQRQVQHLSLLHALSGTKAGDAVKLAYVNAQLAAARAEKGGMRDVGRAFKAQDAGAFEKAANEKLSDAERMLLAENAPAIELVLRENGRIPDLATRLKIFQLNRILKKSGYKLTSSGKLQPQGTAADHGARAQGHGGVEMQVRDGELWVRAAEGSSGITVNGETHKAGEWVAMLEGDSVIIDGKHYARIKGALRPFTVRTESDGPLIVERHKTGGEVRLVVAAGAESIILANADGTLSKISRHKNGAAKLDGEQQALALLQYHGIDIAPRLIGRVNSHELAMGRVPGRTLENMTTKQRQVISEKAWDRFERDVQRMNDLGIMHNDIHAGNIIYDAATQTLRLLDFDNATIGHKSRRDMIDVKQYRARSVQGQPVNNVYRIDVSAPKTKVPVAEIRYEGSGEVGANAFAKMSPAEKAAAVGGVLAVIGGFFFDPMSAMLGLPLLGMVTNSRAAVNEMGGNRKHNIEAKLVTRMVVETLRAEGRTIDEGKIKRLVHEEMAKWKDNAAGQYNGNVRKADLGHVADAVISQLSRANMMWRAASGMTSSQRVAEIMMDVCLNHKKMQRRLKRFGPAQVDHLKDTIRRELVGTVERYLREKGYDSYENLPEMYEIDLSGILMNKAREIALGFIP